MNGWAAIVAAVTSLKRGDQFGEVQLVVDADQEMFRVDELAQLPIGELERSRITSAAVPTCGSACRRWRSPARTRPHPPREGSRRRSPLHGRSSASSDPGAGGPAAPRRSPGGSTGNGPTSRTDAPRRLGREQYAPGSSPVASRSPRLLQLVLQGAGDVGVDHQPHFGLVDAHAE